MSVCTCDWGDGLDCPVHDFLPEPEREPLGTTTTLTVTITHEVGLPIHEVMESMRTTTIEDWCAPRGGQHRDDGYEGPFITDVEVVES